MSAYSEVPNALLDVREAANHPWMGLTGLLNRQPYLVIGKEGNKFILEGEAGDIQKLLQFEWKDATENSRLVAASRQEGSALTKGSVLGGYIVGGVRHHEGEWYVMNESGEDVLPFNSILARIEAHRNDPLALSWEIKEAAGRKLGYGEPDYKCPKCGSNEVRPSEMYDHSIWECDRCGKQGYEEEFLDEPPDYDADYNSGHMDWYPDWQQQEAKVASVFEMPLPPHGIHFRTHAAFRDAGLTATVHYPAIPAYPDGLSVAIPGGGNGGLDDMDYSDEVEDAGGNLQDVIVQVDAPDGQEDQVRSIINKLGGAGDEPQAPVEQEPESF